MQKIRGTATIMLILWVLVLVSCDAAAPDPMGNAALMGTSAAQAGIVAQATIDAATRQVQMQMDAVTSTAVSAEQTRTAESAATTTAIAVHKEEVEIQRMQLEMEQDLEITRVFALATVGAIATDQAVALNASNLQLTRTALENQQLEADIALQQSQQTFWKALPWMGVALVCACLLACFYWMLRQDTPKRVDTGNGGTLVMIRTPDHGWRPVVEMPPQLPGNYIGQRALPAPKREPVITPPYHPDQKEPVYLPDRIISGCLALGVSAQNQAIYPFKEVKDMLVAGEKGSGKSSFLQMLAYQAVRQRWEVYFIDTELLTFDPAVWGFVAQTEREVIGLLDFLVNEMFEYRFALYREAGEKMRYGYRMGNITEPFKVDDLDAYNKAADMFGLRRLSPCLLVWDEASSHFGNNKVVNLLHEFIRRSRKPGVVSILASQSWYSSGPHGLSGVVKARLERRIAFRTDEQTSQMVLGRGNTAATLIPPHMKGHAIMRDNGRLKRMQTYYLPEQNLFRHITPIQAENSPDHSWEPGRDGEGGAPAQTNMTGLSLPDKKEAYEQDAEWLLQQPVSQFGSRRQVATALTGGLDNKYAYERADAALHVLTMAANHPAWAQQAKDLLAAASS